MLPCGGVHMGDLALTIVLTRWSCIVSMNSLSRAVLALFI